MTPPRVIKIPVIGVKYFGVILLYKVDYTPEYYIFFVNLYYKQSFASPLAQACLTQAIVYFAPLVQA